jgi:phosphatidylglycerophosphatase A
MGTAPRPLFSLAFATAFGVGYVPFAPGTFGSLVGIGLWLLLPASAAAQGAAIVFLFAAGSVASHVVERHFGRTDPRQVVIDEVMGMLIALFLVPVGIIEGLVGFLAFRAADVVKPYPAGRLERIPGGIGVMADDAMAAVYANVALRALLAVRQLFA